ncbi:MAG: type II toxin-antitoxin system death-on-curing family toxin [Acidobacteria bacterium]|nr:MAG: type II toxin-antitoxin system death-on-curing family toxin [Acidobacteriota bacterium]REK09813.1 MAG: type II toxin-antitoxin system death-on-curing family toxin [Acidobacteriota bacterium]
MAIHRRQIAEHGGAAGVRDEGLLASALAKPKKLHAYAEQASGFAALAASHAFGIARNHPFLDGNKRTAFVVCRTFLLLNGFELAATREEKYRTFVALAAGELAESELEEWIEQRLEAVAE